MANIPVFLETAMDRVSEQSPYTQIALGAGSGALTGFVLLKVGKVLAIWVGGAIILVELAVVTGIVKIDYDRVDEQLQQRDLRSMRLMPRVKNWLTASARTSIAFIGGFLIGFGLA